MRRFALYDRWDRYVGELRPLSAKWVEDVDGTDTVTIRTFRNVEKGWRVVWRDDLGDWHEHVVDEMTTSHGGGRPVSTLACINSISETYGDHIADTRLTAVDSATALGSQLRASGSRWELGTCDATGYYDEASYDTTLREAIAQDVKDYGAELETTIIVGVSGVTGRTVGLRAARGNASAHHRLTYDRNLSTISRKVGSSEIYTALYGRGKGVETDTGGYGRRLRFDSVNPTGRDYVEDATLLANWGRPDGRGGRAHYFGRVVYDNVTDAQRLLDLTTEALHAQTPYVSYECSVAATPMARWRLGDTCDVIDRDFPVELRLSARVTRLERDLLAEDGTGTITIGTSSRTLTDIVAEQNAGIKATDAAAVQASASSLSRIEGSQYYVYHATNQKGISAAQVQESDAVELELATVADARVVAQFICKAELDRDGDVVMRLYAEGTLLDTFEGYYPRGLSLLQFVWSGDFSANIDEHLRVTLQTRAVRSQIRENDADNATLWNRVRAGSVFSSTWGSVLQEETWETMATESWDSTQQTVGDITWGSLTKSMGTSSYVEVEPSMAAPALTAEPEAARLIAYGRGLAETDDFGNKIEVSDTFPLPYTDSGWLSVGFSDSPSVSTQTPVREGAFSEALDLAVGAEWLEVGLADAATLGPYVWTIAPGSLDGDEYEANALSVGSDRITARQDATITTPELGTDAANRGVSSVALDADSGVTWSVSFDGGQTWQAGLSSWAEATPFRVRVSMPADTSMRSLTVNFAK